MTARAAFFDLDRTVLSIDSGMSWIRFRYRNRELSRLELGRALYWGLLYRLAILDLESLALKLVAEAAGDSEADMWHKSGLWYRQTLSHQIAPLARRAIDEHRARGEIVALLTGSSQFAAEPIARELGIEHVMCSRIQVRDGRFTGQLDHMCFGRHKVPLAEAFARAHGVDLQHSVFYSDSYNDLPMFERVGSPVVVNPDGRLRGHANRVGWPIRHWR